MSSTASQITDVGSQCGSCGYCGGQDSSCSHGMIAKTLTVQDYQDLIDLGWRRSGKYIYKPNSQQTCCPPYTIRMPANEFEPDRDQVRMLKKMARYLDGHGAPIHLAAIPNGAGGKQQQQQQTAQSSQTPAQPSRLQDLQAKPALATMLSAAAQILQAAGILPEQMDMPALMVVPRSSGRPKQRKAEQHAQQPTARMASGSQGAGPPRAIGLQAAPNSTALDPSSSLGGGVEGAVEAVHASGAGLGGEGSLSSSRALKRNSSGNTVISDSREGQSCLELSSPCCFALAAAAQRAHHPNPHAVGSDSNTPGHQAGRATPAELATHMQEALVHIQHGLCSGAALPVASMHKNAQNTKPMQAVDAAVARVKADVGTLATQTGNAPSPMADKHAAGCDSLLRVLGSCQVAAAGGYLNFLLPWADTSQSAACDGGAVQVARYSKQAKIDQDNSQTVAGNGGASSSGVGCSEPAATTAGSGGAGGKAGAGTEGSSRLEVVMVPSQFIEEEYQLYKRYQTAQHNDAPEDITPAQYKSFLVDTPLPKAGQRKHTPTPASSTTASPITVTAAHATAAATTVTRAGGRPLEAGAAQALADADVSGAAGRDAAPSVGFGSFHMQYRIDGQLVAVGVVDLLPRCLSSVYLFWDPALRSLGLGRLTALYELIWVQQASKVCPDLKWLYMGFYIHSCHKMRYKADYRPSDLLCPTNNVWVRISPPVLTALDQQPCATLSTLPGVTAFRNWAHTELEAGASAAAAGLQLLPGSDALCEAGNSSRGKSAGRQPAASDALPAPGARQGAGSGKTAPGTSGGGATRVASKNSMKLRPGECESNAEEVSAGDVTVLLWGKTTHWKVLRQEITAAGTRMINQHIQDWLQLVGSLGRRFVYCLE